MSEDNDFNISRKSILLKKSSFNTTREKGFLIKNLQHQSKKSLSTKFNLGLLDFVGHSYNNEKINLRLNTKRGNANDPKVHYTERKSMKQANLFSNTPKKYPNNYIPPMLNSGTSIYQLNRSKSVQNNLTSFDKFQKKNQVLLSANLNKMKIKSSVDQEPSKFSNEKIKYIMGNKNMAKTMTTTFTSHLSPNNKPIKIDNASHFDSNYDIESEDKFGTKDNIRIFNRKYIADNPYSGFEHKPARAMDRRGIDNLPHNTEWTRRRLIEHKKNTQDPNNKIKHIFKNLKDEKLQNHCQINKNKSLQEKISPKVFVKSNDKSFLKSICINSLNNPNQIFTSRLQTQSTFRKNVMSTARKTFSGDYNFFHASGGENDLSNTDREIARFEPLYTEEKSDAQNDDESLKTSPKKGKTSLEDISMTEESKEVIDEAAMKEKFLRETLNQLTGEADKNSNVETIFKFTKEDPYNEIYGNDQGNRQASGSDPLFVAIIPKGQNLDTDMILRPDQEENIKMTHPELYHNLCESYIVSNDNQSNEPNYVKNGNKVLRMMKLRRALKTFINKLIKLKIPREDFFSMPVFSHKPYEKELSRKFIDACKDNEIDTIKELLKKDRYLVYDFDYIGLTGLHWGCKFGHGDQAEIQCQANADVEARDTLGRTPLYFAIQSVNTKCIKALLMNDAEPWSYGPNCSYKEMVKDNTTACLYLQKCRTLDMTLRMTNYKQREEIKKNMMKTIFIK